MHPENNYEHPLKNIKYQLFVQLYEKYAILLQVIYDQ